MKKKIMDTNSYWYIDDGSGICRETLREIRAHVHNAYKDYKDYVRLYVVHVVNSEAKTFCTFSLHNGREFWSKPLSIAYRQFL